MSYILEALRKSQQERDLGRVPTLESLPAPTAETAAGLNYWGAAAVGLAALAVVIALYAVLRGAPERAEEAQSADLAAPQSAVTPANRTGLASQPAVPGPAQAGAKTAGSSAPADAGLEPGLPPQPAGTISGTPREPAPGKASDLPRPETASEPAGAGPVRDDGIPNDLRQEIEEFKREIRGQPPADERADAAAVRPQDLRLPREVRQRLPDFLMTVHIYHREREKRFVHIDSREYREGERTRKEILVEEILPDGVVLSYDGHRFFRRR